MRLPNPSATNGGRAPAPPGSLPFKAAVLAGIGLTIAIWSFVGIYVSRRLAAMESQTTALSDRYQAAQQLLAEIRDDVHSGAASGRLALLAETEAEVAQYIRTIQQIAAHSDTRLTEYEPVIDRELEREHVESIRGHLRTLNDLMLEQIRARPQTPALVGNALRAMLPPRETTLDAIEDLQGRNRTAFILRQTTSAATYRATQQQTWLALGLSVLASLAIALLASAYVGRLERRLTDQYALDLAIKEELQRLSNRLLRVQEDERRTLARELHDDIGQLLSAVKVELVLAQRTIKAIPGPPDVLNHAQAIAEQALHTVRDLSRLLHPAVLDDLGLVVALERQVRSFEDRHGIQVDFAAPEIHPRLAGDVEMAAYRIVQEALTNIARHAAATHGRVHLACDTDQLTLEIEDDGRGFEPGAVQGLGLVSMRERAQQLGGSIGIDSAPGRGTRITVVLPALRRQEDEVVEAHAQAG